MQSIQEPAFAMPVMDPLVVKEDYDPVVEDELLNGFFGGSPAGSFIFMNDDENMDVAVFNDLQKAAVFNTSLIPFKTTRTTQGVQVMISKRGSQLVSLKPLTEEMFTDCEYYRVRKIPAIGYYIRENSIESKQIGMEGI